jgi:phage/plasmid primase-like uncharacterized protein
MSQVTTKTRKRLPFPEYTTVAGAKHYWAKTATIHYNQANTQQLATLANQLSISATSLDKLGIGWSKKLGAYTIPELNEQQEMTGIALRYPDGRKGCIQGSLRGLTIPRGFEEYGEPIMIVEGASDVAALTTVGVAAIGRPSARGGFNMVADLLKGHKDKQIIVMGENDAKSDASWTGRNAAEELAKHLANHLGVEVFWTLPPNEAKDIREYFIQLTKRGNREAS